MKKKSDKLTEAPNPRGRIRIKKDGKVATILSDTEYCRNRENLELKYDTTVNGRLFHVASVLPVHPVSTPTEKMKSYIDLRLEVVNIWRATGTWSCISSK